LKICGFLLSNKNKHKHAHTHTSLARRISAISIAERVAQEQCLTSSSETTTTTGGVGSLVGYQVRLESASSKDTQLLFLTPGVLLRKLQSSPMLSEYTHIIIDEVHERDKYTEFLMIRLRDLLPLRPDLRLVLMSATLQTEVLMNYFAPSANNNIANNDFYEAHPPVMLSIEGRTFPVQEFFVRSKCVVVVLLLLEFVLGIYSDLYVLLTLDLICFVCFLVFVFNLNF